MIYLIIILTAIFDKRSFVLRKPDIVVQLMYAIKINNKNVAKET